MSGTYRSIIQTGYFFVFTACSGTIIEKLTNINNSLIRIENQMNIRESKVYQNILDNINYLNKKEE